MSTKRVTIRHIEKIAPFSRTSTEVITTGHWSPQKPIFVEKTSPCREACPVGNDMARAFHLASLGNYDEALALIRQENPLPGVCGRVCYHPCETACNRASWDEPVNIRGLERFVSDHGNVICSEAPMKLKNPLKVGVVGSGPCGLSAAYHLARLGYSVSLFEAMPLPGGMLRYGIPAYRLPKEVLDREIQQIRKMGVSILCNRKLGRDLQIRDLRKHFNALFLALGAHNPMNPGLEGEELEGVIKGIDFLRDLNQGLEIGLGEKVVVVGGGNTAMDCARSALRLGARDVVVLYRRGPEQMPALPEEVKAAQKEGVRIQPFTSPARILGKGGRLWALECQRMEAGPLDEKGRPLSVPIPGSGFNLPLDTLILATGQLPHTPFAGGAGLAVDEMGLIKTSFPNPATNLEGVFASGDCAGGKALVADAIAGGKMGALAIHCFLQEKDFPEELEKLRIGERGAFSFQALLEPEGREVNLKSVVGIKEINTLCFPRASRKHNPQISGRGFQESVRGLDPAQLQAEARRCFKCGTCTQCDLCYLLCPDISITKSEQGYGLDAEHCKGCGQCAATCPRNVVQMGGKS